MKRRKESYDSDFFITVLREATMSKCEMKNPPDFFVSLDIWEDVCRKIKSLTNDVNALIELSYGKTKIYGCNVYLAKGAPGRTIKVGRDVEGNTPLRNTKGVKQDEESRESRLKREISEGLAQFLILNDVDPNEVRVIVSYPDMQATITLSMGGRHDVGTSNRNAQKRI